MNLKTKTKMLVVVFAMFVSVSLSLPLSDSTDVKIINAPDIEETNSPDSDSEEINVFDIIVTNYTAANYTAVNYTTVKQASKSSLTIYSSKLRYIPDDIEVESDEDEDDNTFSTVPRMLRSKDADRTYYHSDQRWIDERYVHGDRFLLYFDLIGFPSDEMVYKVKLNLILVPDRKPADVSNCTQDTLIVTVYDMVLPGVKNKSEPLLEEVDTRFVDVDPSSSIETTVSVDVKTIVINRWLANAHKNWGLIVDVKSPGCDKPASRLRYKRHAVDDVDSWKFVPSTPSGNPKKVNLPKVGKKKRTMKYRTRGERQT